MNVFHALLSNFSHLLHSGNAAHAADCVTLHKDVTTRHQLQRLQRAAIRSNQTLPALGKPLFIADHVLDLDDVAIHIILKNFDSLQRIMKQLAYEKLGITNSFSRTC